MTTITAGNLPRPSLLLNLIGVLREKLGRLKLVSKTPVAQDMGRLHLNEAIMRDIGIGPRFARPTLDYYRQPF